MEMIIADTVVRHRTLHIWEILVKAGLTCLLRTCFGSAASPKQRIRIAPSFFLDTGWVHSPRRNMCFAAVAKSMDSSSQAQVCSTGSRDLPVQHQQEATSRI